MLPATIQICFAVLVASLIVSIPLVHAVDCFADNATLTFLPGEMYDQVEVSLSLWPADPFPSECEGGELAHDSGWREGLISLTTNLGTESFSTETTDISKPITASTSVSWLREDMIAGYYTVSIQFGTSVADVTKPLALIERQISNYSCEDKLTPSSMFMESVGEHTRFCMTYPFNSRSTLCYELLDSPNQAASAKVVFTLPDSGGTYVVDIQISFPTEYPCDDCFNGIFDSNQLFCFDCADLRCEKMLTAFSSTIAPTATIRIIVEVTTDDETVFPIKLSHTSQALSTKTYQYESLSLSPELTLYESKILVAPSWQPEEVEGWGLGSTFKGSIEITVTVPPPPSRPDLAPLQLSKTFTSLPEASFDLPCSDSVCTAQIEQYLQKSYGETSSSIDYAYSTFLVRIRDSYGSMVDRVTVDVESISRACFTRAYQHFQGKSVIFTFSPLADPCDLRVTAPTTFTLEMYEIATVTEEVEAGADSGEGDGSGEAGGPGTAGDSESGETTTTRTIERKIATFRRSVFEPPLDLNQLTFTCDDYVLQAAGTLSEYDYDHDCSTALEHAKKLIVRGKGAYRSYITNTANTPPIEALAWTNRDLDNVFIVLAVCVIVVLFAGTVWGTVSVRMFKRKQGAMNE